MANEREFEQNQQSPNALMKLFDKIYDSAESSTSAMTIKNDHPENVPSLALWTLACELPLAFPIHT